jgi:hypothetical protein
MAATDLHQLAEDVLAACVASLDTIPDADPTLAGAPERSFVSPGVPVWDCCEQLVVWVPGVTQQTTRPSGAGEQARQHVFGRIPLARIEITISRCVPAGEINGTEYVPPAVTDLEATAAQMHADAWALYNGLFNRIAQGILTDVCDEVAWDGLQAATPSGGCGGWTINLRFQLDGYGYTDPIGS